MEFDEMRSAAESRLSPETWSYFAGTADGDLDRDARAWSRWDFVPSVMTGLTEIDTSIKLGADTFAAPIMLAPSASQGALHPDGELATRAAADETGLLVGYSFHATVEVERFARASSKPWWAQAYAMADRRISDGYLRQCADGGARAVVLTVDVPGSLADAPFRRLPFSAPVASRGNYPKDADGNYVPVVTESNLSPDEIGRTAEVSGLPVWVKGVMTAADATRAIDAGAAGVIVSNHARRQLPGVAPTATVLRDVVLGVAGRAPVLVDGGIRSGADVVRALALGASAVAIGRPVIWALASGGREGLISMLSTFTDEVRVAMAALGAGKVSDLVPTMTRLSDNARA